MIARGLRNNNPGNIRLGQPWAGQVEGEDKSFCTFQSAEYGIRALCKLLLTYYNRYNLDTVEGIINRYAPPSENDTGGYQSHVAACLGVGVGQCINVEDKAVMRVLLESIIKHENGSCPYTVEIDKGMELAGLK